MKRLHAWAWSLLFLVGCRHALDFDSDGRGPSLQLALIRAIQSHYVEEMDVGTLLPLSVTEIVARLDRDSSLREVEPPSLAFIRGFELEGSVSGLTILSDETCHGCSRRVGYLRIGFFGRRTVQDVLHALEGAKPSPCDGLILDLRGNPGGRVEIAIQLAGLFLPEGVHLGRFRGRGADVQSYVSRGPVRWTEPVIVLIDRGTASSAELFAGLLQYHHRVRLMGTPTAGKSTVQTALPLDHRHLLFLTTGRYLLPDGSAVAATGLQPDDVVVGEAEAMAKALSRLLEDGATCEVRTVRCGVRSAKCEGEVGASVPAE